MAVTLLEVVYEGGDVLDVALSRQRIKLAKALGAKFLTADLRGIPMKKRGALLRGLGELNPKFVLLRGTSGMGEAAPFFRRSIFFLDYLARKESAPPGSLSRWTYRIVRAFVYSSKADLAVRRAGVGAVSFKAGPGLRSLPAPPPEGKMVVGVLELGDGAARTLIRLKRVRKAGGEDFDIISTKRMGGVLHADSAFEVAESSRLLIAPMDSPDFGGPNEPSLLAMSVKRALCTAPTSAFYTLPSAARSKIVEATKHSPGTYAMGIRTYAESPSRYLHAFDGVDFDPEDVPKEILRRIN